MQKAQLACIVLPTYNEAENISSLLEWIFRVAKSMRGWELHVLVVDDNSPDGTAGMVKKSMKKHHNTLHLLNGSKQGLGVAYVRGFTYAMEKLNPAVIFEMDADFSHPPTMIPLFLKKIEDGNDLVVGSRYIQGGNTPDWNLKRKIISRGGNLFARVVAGLNNVHDCTSGYRAIKASLLKSIDLQNLGAKGYSFQMNLLYEAVVKKAKIAEIPLVFHDRTKGQSKMKTSDLVEFFINSFHLRLRTWERFIKFSVVGTSGVAVNSIILAVLSYEFNVDYRFASIAAIQSAILWNFFLNDNWTFRDLRKKKPLLGKILKFEGISILGAAMNWTVLVLLTEKLGVFYMISNLVGIAVAVTWNYLMNASYTWREDG